ncbi:hypothetical protein [Microcella sp.]|uniref:hypothetical protein n=1 Tax=Microcella sp. TaxID=1913979 RepID=UPI00256B9EC2|nr:hypothetical protein [Microcella sp.]MBX9470667.1 hypothetical protein [Microcella sp.]
MTTASISLTVPHRPVSNRRTPFFRRLVLSTGLALVTWARRPVQRPTHEQQALRLAAQAAAARQRDSLRYGIAQ